MRRAKDNSQVPKRYYCPEQTHCPRCRHMLKRAYPLWRKYIVFLSGRYLVISVGCWCRNPQCQEAKHKRLFASQAAEALTLRGSSFALEVIVQIGYWRFGKRWTVAQIHKVLTQEYHLPISEREVLYLIGVFLMLLRCTSPLRLAEHAAYFRQHGLFLALDALKPEKGNTALYVVRDLKFGLVLHEVALLTTDHHTLATHVLQPVKALGYRIRGVVSMVKGLFSLTRPSPSSKCCNVFSSLIKLRLIRSMPGFVKPSSDYKCCLVFAIGPNVVSGNWSDNGLRPFVTNLVKQQRVEFCGCWLFPSFPCQRAATRSWCSPPPGENTRTST